MNLPLLEMFRLKFSLRPLRLKAFLATEQIADGLLHYRAANF